MGSNESERPIANAIIVGVNKAGTTSLFVSLSGHPEIAPAAVKETKYFLPPRWGQPVGPRSDYETEWAGAGPEPVRLEATPSYFYGGEPVIRAMRDVCGSDLKVVVVLREPAARLVSFFQFQKARLRLPEDMTLEEYLAESDQRTDADFRDAENEMWFGFRGGWYADFLPVWRDAFGDRLHVVFFEALMRDPGSVLREVAAFLGVDPEAFSDEALSSENRTTGFKNRGFQRFALAFNNRFERFLRRHYKLKDRLRSAYYRVNGRRAKEHVPEAVLVRVRERYEEPNARLADQLAAMGITDPPAWITSSRASTRPRP
jgi:hypothetical protein